ncbi:high choriolytic enzyme 1-like [Phyllopteryx taeniolatus]|uniref:high choriolytic enzyme 1-like n=1 Tax=Phyllopteryx taeniolatus TaxID=161469 RepID=UPI002AD557D7|nr:high choriolytic enzyme 1-like [Phyllopteryx taeniolatus]
MRSVQKTAPLQPSHTCRAEYKEGRLDSSRTSIFRESLHRNSKRSRFAGPLMLLLLGLAQAYQDEEFQEQDGEDTVDISTTIVTINNGSEVILLEGDPLVPKTRNAMKCRYQSCLWNRAANGYVTIPYVVSREFPEWEKRKIETAMRSFHGSTCIRFVPRSDEYDYKGGCYSALGRQGGKQVVSINRGGLFFRSNEAISSVQYIRGQYCTLPAEATLIMRSEDVQCMNPVLR